MALSLKLGLLVALHRAARGSRWRLAAAAGIGVVTVVTLYQLAWPSIRARRGLSPEPTGT